MRIRPQPGDYVGLIGGLVDFIDKDLRSTVLPGSIP